MRHDYYSNIGVNPANLTRPDFVPLDYTLQSYWKFDEGTGTTAYDSKGTKNLTMSASTLWTTASQSYDGMAMAGSGYASVGSFTATSPFTFAAWIKPTSTSGTQYIASTKNGSSRRLILAVSQRRKAHRHRHDRLDRATRHP